MISQKKLSLKRCIKCKIILTIENWNKYDEKVSHYICHFCRKIQDKARYSACPDYCKKQTSKYRSRKSAIIHSYGDQCINCGEDDYYKLTLNYNKPANCKKKSNYIYSWLYNNPVQRDGYQILCHNCNSSKNIIYKDKYALRDKIKVIEAYGNQCKECEETRIERLILNHKNNDGAEQRRHLKYGTGIMMYRWLIKNNFPTHLGLQILCYNCNYSKLLIQ